MALEVSGVIIVDAGYIGSASDTDALQIDSSGNIILTQDLQMASNKGLSWNSGALTINYDGSSGNINTTGTGISIMVDEGNEIRITGGLVTINGNLTVTGVCTLGTGVIFPTSDPSVAGQWWDNAGTLTKSAG